MILSNWGIFPLIKYNSRMGFLLMLRRSWGCWDEPKGAETKLGVQRRAWGCWDKPGGAETSPRVLRRAWGWWDEPKGAETVGRVKTSKGLDDSTTLITSQRSFQTFSHCFSGMLAPPSVVHFCTSEAAPSHQAGWTVMGDDKLEVCLAMY